MTASLYNCALIRYEGGHLYLDRADGHRRRELYIELGGVKDADVALGFARRILANAATVYRSDAIEGTIATRDHVPTVGYGLGDLLAGKRLHGYTVSLTDEGTSVVPELDDPWDLAEAALARRIKRTASGIVSEYSRPNITRPDTGKGTDSEPPDFSQDGPVAPTLSPPWTAERPYWCAWLHLKLAVPGTTPTSVGVGRLLPGPSIAVVAVATIPAGEREGLARVNAGWNVGEDLIVGVRSAGAGAQKLTASLRGVMV